MPRFLVQLAAAQPLTGDQLTRFRERISDELSVVGPVIVFTYEAKSMEVARADLLGNFELDALPGLRIESIKPA